MEVDFPGLSKKDIRINVQDNVLTIEGEREKKVKKESNGYLRSERSFGKFQS
ncbi:Hsp20/alpha crystallin family protein [Halalkalibaculum sp. DA384]|uniref:Hsp20/alpha crystallin family protein n=1 Tax=Halalkalibaculum sp. DA384 TaxID=3373606 RepID=UPI00375440DD